MAQAATHKSHSSESAHHIHSVAFYVKTFLWLTVLMFFTVAFSYFDFGAANLYIALAIAVTKAAIVVLYFMNVKFGTKLTWLWAALGFMWFVLMFGILGDYVTRDWIRLPQGW